MIKKIKNYLISGLLVIAPLFITFWVLRYLLRLADTLVVDPLFGLLPIDIEATFKIILAKLAIAFCVILFVAFVGLLAKKFFVRQFFSGANAVLKNIPIFNKVYGSVQEIIEAFFGDKRGVFQQVAFVEFPRKGVYSVGFVTQSKPWEIHAKTGKEMLTLFVPHPPNPAAGVIVFVPREEVIMSDMSVEEGIKLVISAGAAIPALKEKLNLKSEI